MSWRATNSLTTHVCSIHYTMYECGSDSNENKHGDILKGTDEGLYGLKNYMIRRISPGVFTNLSENWPNAPSLFYPRHRRGRWKSEVDAGVEINCQPPLDSVVGQTDSGVHGHGRAEPKGMGVGTVRKNRVFFRLLVFIVRIRHTYFHRLSP